MAQEPHHVRGKSRVFGSSPTQARSKATRGRSTGQRIETQARKTAPPITAEITAPVAARPSDAPTGRLIEIKAWPSAA